MVSLLSKSFVPNLLAKSFPKIDFQLMNNYMELKINGPSLKEFTADAVIVQWLKNSNSGGSKHLDGHKTSNS